MLGDWGPVTEQSGEHWPSRAGQTLLPSSDGTSTSLSDLMQDCDRDLVKYMEQEMGDPFLDNLPSDLAGRVESNCGLKMLESVGIKLKENGVEADFSTIMLVLEQTIRPMIDRPFVRLVGEGEAGIVGAGEPPQGWDAGGFQVGCYMSIVRGMEVAEFGRNQLLCSFLICSRVLPQRSCSHDTLCIVACYVHPAKEIVRTGAQQEERGSLTTTSLRTGGDDRKILPQQLIIL